MTVSDYLYEAKSILEKIILLGIAFRAVQTVLTRGIEQGDWFNTWHKIKKLVYVGILSVSTLEFIVLLRSVYYGG